MASARMFFWGGLCLLIAACAGRAQPPPASGMVEVQNPLGPPIQPQWVAGGEQEARRPPVPLGNVAQAPAPLPEPISAPALGDAGDPQLAPGAGMALVHHPLHRQLDAFFVDTQGSLIALWKENNLAWRNLGRLSARNFAPSGAFVAAAYFADEPTVEVFVVDQAGALNVTSQDRDGAWRGPVQLTQPGFAPPGAPIAAVYRPGHARLLVTVVDNEGALASVERARRGAWSAPQRISEPGFAPLGAAVAGAHYASFEQFAFFVVDPRGALRSAEQSADGRWQLGRVTAENIAPKGAPLAIVYQPLHEQLEVFLTDTRGALQVVSRRANGPWNAPLALTRPAFLDAGAAVAAVHFPPAEHLEVFVVDKSGTLDVIWKIADGRWQAAGAITAQPLRPGSATAAAYNANNDQLEVLTTDADGVLHLQWKVGNGPWKPCTLKLAGSPSSNAERQIERGRCANNQLVPN